jgi:hypothetical protein
MCRITYAIRFNSLLWTTGKKFGTHHYNNVYKLFSVREPLTNDGWQILVDVIRQTLLPPCFAFRLPSVTKQFVLGNYIFYNLTT